MRKHSLAAVVLAALLPLAGCNFEAAQDAVENVKLVIGLEPINTVVGAQFIDAKTGDLVAGKVEVTYGGPDQGAVIDLFSEPMTRQTAEGGLTSFGIRNEVNPSATSPLRVQVTAVAPGYEPASVTVPVATTGSHSVKLYLVPKGMAPEGAVAVQDHSGRAGAGGAVEQQVVVASGDVSAAQVSAQVTVPQGTIARDASGAVLSGALQTSLTYFSNQQATSLRALPGGFSSVLVTATGDRQASLVTAGFAAIEMRDGAGRQARTFSQPLTVAFEVPRNTVNPTTGTTVRSGDEIGVWSYENDRGVWVEEGKATLTGPNADGNLVAEYQAPHLSYWNVAWQSQECALGATINVNRNGRSGDLGVTVTAPGYNATYTLRAGENQLQFSGVPQGISGTVLVSGETQPVAVSDFCSGTYTVNLTPPAAEVLDVRFKLVPVCAAPDEAVRVKSIPTVMVLYRKANAAQGDEWLQAGSPTWTFSDAENRLVSGELAVGGLERGATYTFKTTYDGDTYSTDLDVTGPYVVYEEEVPGDYCN